MNALLLISQILVSDPAVVTSVTGYVEVVTSNQTVLLQRFDQVQEGETVITHENSTAQLRLSSGSTIRLAPQTNLTLREMKTGRPAANRKEGLKLLTGKIWAKVSSLWGDDSKFEVATDNAVAGVRGTSFTVESDGQGDERFTLIEGAIVLKGFGDELLLDSPGASAQAQGGSFQPVQNLDVKQRRTLLANIGGGGGKVVEELGENLDLGDTNVPEGGQDREDMRGTLVNPDAAVDETIQPDTLAPGSSDATVRIQLNLVERP